MQSHWMQMTDTSTALELVDAPVPEPGPRQLLARVHAASLDRATASARARRLMQPVLGAARTQAVIERVNAIETMPRIAGS